MKTSGNAGSQAENGTGTTAQNPAYPTTTDPAQEG